MAVFSVNQNRQFYVATAVADEVKETSEAGVLQVKTLDNGVNKELYFMVKGAENVLKSDRIPLRNLSYVKAVKKEDMRVPLKKVVVKFSEDSSAVHPILGQDYILRINFRQFYGMSDQDQYFKDAAVHVTSSMADMGGAEAFFTKMVESLNNSFSREVGATKDSNPYLSFELGDDKASLVIIEKPQDWTLGTQAQERVYFDVVPTTVYANGVEEVWGEANDETPTKEKAEEGKYIPNGKKIADLEWFCMGERGDQYRQIGWPNNIDTKYLVSADKEYNVLEIHFAFTDEGTESYRSEKDITIVSEDAGVINEIVGKINDATGLSIDKLA